MDKPLALITGSTGFIGSHLLKLLAEEGWHTRVTVRANSNLQKLAGVQCEKVELDLGRSTPASISQALEGVTHVFHVAGLVCGTRQRLDEVNRVGTTTLIQAAAAQPEPPIFNLISSAAAGGPWSESPGRPPSERPAPVSDYGSSKLAGERTAIEHRGSCPLTIVRPGIVFGEGDTEFIRIVRAITKTRINPMIGRGHQPLSMIDVRDLVSLIVAAAKSGERVSAATEQGDSQEGCGVYNAADMEPISLVKLGDIVSQASGNLRYLNLRLPIPIGYCVGAASEFATRLVGKTSTLNRDKIREAKAPGWVIDPSKSMQDLQWSPEKQIRDRLRELVEHGRQAGLL